MTFYSNFSDKYGNRYELEISSNGGGEVDLTMGGNPCIISSASDKLFAPIKSRSCSLEIATTEWYLDLYEPTSRGTTVKVYEYDENAQYHQGRILFRGYLTPCSYDQTFTYLDTITLEAVDAISTAKDYKWQNNGQYNSFFDIVIGIVRSAGYRGSLFVPQTYEHINNQSVSGDVLDKLFASSTNFLDDNAERTPWTEYEVLEEVMQFLGWSLCPDGDDVWCIDYRAENDGAVTYTKYDIPTGTANGTFVSPSTTTAINLNDITAGTSSISIDDIYNKIEVSDNLYKIDEISPDIFDDTNHISVTDEAELGEDQSKWSTVRRKKFLWWSWDSNKEKDYQEGTDYQTLCRLEPASGWTHYFYKMSDMTPVDNSDGLGYYDEATDLDPDQMAWGYDATARPDGSKTIKKVNTHGCLLQHYAYIDESHPNNVPTSVDWTDILTFFVLGPTSTPVPLGDINNRLQKKVLEYNIAETVQWKPSSGKSWITIKGSLFYQNGTDYKDGKKTQRLSIVNAEQGWYATTPVDKSLKNLPADMNYAGINCIRSESDPEYGNGFRLWRMEVQIGDKYWAESYNTTNHKWEGYWTTVPSSFYVAFNNNPDNEKDEFIPAFQWMNIVSTTTYKDQVGEDCYAIPIDSEKADDPSFGTLRVAIYTPNIIPEELLAKYQAWWGNATVGFGTLAPVIYCKDFEIGYVYTDTSVWWENHSDNNETDKVYIGYIDDDYIKDFDTIEMKLNTSIQDRPISRSFVSTNDGYLGTMKHVVGDTDKEQEYNIVDLYLDHHSDRKVIFNQNMHGMFAPYRKFSKSQFNGNLMIDSYSYDVRDDNNNIKFIQF